jgi:hypothetical protein
MPLNQKQGSSWYIVRLKFELFANREKPGRALKLKKMDLCKEADGDQGTSRAFDFGFNFVM